MSLIISARSAQRALDAVRAYRNAVDSGRPPNSLSRKILRVRHELWSIVSGTDIAFGATIGANLRLPHPNGVIIHELSVIGDNCLIMQQVTIGQLADGPAPVLGSNVYIGAGAKVLGRVSIGDGAAIGANSVVLADVPAGATAVGVPARIVKKRVTR